MELDIHNFIPYEQSHKTGKNSMVRCFDSKSPCTFAVKLVVATMCTFLHKLYTVVLSLSHQQPSDSLYFFCCQTFHTCYLPQRLVSALMILHSFTKHNRPRHG